MTEPKATRSYNMRCLCGHGSHDHAGGTTFCLDDGCECKRFHRVTRRSSAKGQDPRTLPNDQRRDVNITAMVTLGEAEAIYAAAEKSGCTASTWMRQVLLNEVARLV